AIYRFGIVSDFRLADKRWPIPFSDPYDRRAAALDAFCFPAIGSDLNNDRLIRHSSEPNRSGFALIAVLPDRGDVNETCLRERIGIALRHFTKSYALNGGHQQGGDDQRDRCIETSSHKISI